MAGAQTHITLTHIATKHKIVVPIEIRNFVQEVTPAFSSTEVYGRMDPIYTYKNTKRTFQLTCDMMDPQKVLIYVKKQGSEPVLTKLKTKLLAVKGSKRREIYAKFQAQSLSAIYQFMYPVYEREEHTATGGATVSTLKLKSPPILRINVPNVINGGAGNTGLVFVPETFTVTKGFADAAKVQMTISSISELKYIAPMYGFGFTIGGTVLHEVDPPAFSYTSGSTSSTATFTKDTFPLGAVAIYSPTSILNGTE